MDAPAKEFGKLGLEFMDRYTDVCHVSLLIVIMTISWIWIKFNLPGMLSVDKEQGYPTFMMSNSISSNEVLAKLKEGLKDPRVTSIERSSKGAIVVLTSWLKFDVVVDQSWGRVTIKSGWNPSKMIIVFISVLIFVLPMILLSLSKIGEQMQIPKEIQKVLA